MTWQLSVLLHMNWIVGYGCFMVRAPIILILGTSSDKMKINVFAGHLMHCYQTIGQS